ncbi:MAG TPA: DUF4397 domain-containing protein [Gemmatimonadales bacterium]|nr:DUF4397 domain-containing protein [Gemmatimonadales bacterium]
MVLRFRAALVLVGTLVFAACGDDEVPAGRVRVGHLSPDAGTVNLYVNGNEVLPGITYPNSTLYYDVREGSNEVSLRSNATGATLLAATVNISGSADRTVLAVNTAANLEALVLTDDNSQPAAGRARVRLVHAAPSAGLVDVYITDPGATLVGATPTVAGVAFKDVSDYLDVAAGTYRVRATEAGTTDVVIDQVLNATALLVTTISATETVGGGAPYTLTVFVDRFTP